VPIAVVVVLVLPWTIRNATTFHRFVAVSNNFGAVLLGANCDGAYHGVHEGWWDFGCVGAFAGESPQNRIGPTSMNEADVYTRWRNEGISYALDHPGDFVRVMPARVARTWGLYWHPANQLDNDLTEGRNRTLQIIGYVVALVLLPLMVVGGVLLWRRAPARRGVVLILAAPVALTVVISALTYGTTRFRIMAEPTIAVFAAVALVAVVERFSRPRVRGGRTTASEPARAT